MCILQVTRISGSPTVFEYLPDPFITGSRARQEPIEVAAVKVLEAVHTRVRIPEKARTYRYRVA